MSEFSSSFHIRTADAPAAEKALACARFRGLVFGPKNGWLTFVPYAEDDDGRDVPPDTIVKLAEAVNALALYYSCAEDHGWSFTVVDPGRPPGMFACSWNAQTRLTRHDLDLRIFEGIAATADLEKFLTEPADAIEWNLEEPDEDLCGQALAHGFAKALGLPAYEWLSPDLVTRDTEHFVANGGRRLGRKKPSAEKRLKLPPSTKLEIPTKDMSARQALEIVTPLVAGLGPAWTLYAFNGRAHHYAGKPSPDCRSDWQFWYLKAKTRDTVCVYVVSNGSAGIRALGKMPRQERMSPAEIRDAIARFAGMAEMAHVVRQLEQELNSPSPPPKLELPENWLDSPRIAQIARGLEPPEEIAKPVIGMLGLSWGSMPEARWRVSCSPSGFKSWNIEIDALTGEVLYETLVGPRSGEFVGRTCRERLRGGPWRDA